MKYLKLFEEINVEDLLQQQEELDRLHDLGLADNQEYRSGSAKIRAALNQYIKAKLKRIQHPMYSESWLNEARNIPEFGWFTGVIDSPEYSELVQKGVSLASSITQLLNHTLVFAKNGIARDAKKEFAIGFFGSINVVRRLVPTTGMQDVTMKRFDSNLSESEFFKTAMKWTVDHIDFDSRSFDSKKTVASAAKSGQETTVLRDLVSRLVQADLANISGRDHDRLTNTLFGAIGGNDSASRTRAIRELTKYFEKGQATLTVDGYYSLNQDLITILSKPNIKIKTPGDQYSFEGSITNLNGFNMLPTSKPTVGNISLRAANSLNNQALLGSLDLIFSKLASIGVSGVNYINAYRDGQYSHQVRNIARGDEADSLATEIQELAAKHGIDWFYPM